MVAQGELYPRRLQGSYKECPLFTRINLIDVHKFTHQSGRDNIPNNSVSCRNGLVMQFAFFIVLHRILF